MSSLGDSTFYIFFLLIICHLLLRKLISMVLVNIFSKVSMIFFKKKYIESKNFISKGAVAEPYLIKQGLSLTTLEPPYSWVTDGNADAVGDINF